MTRELKIEHNHRMGFRHGLRNGNFVFVDDTGVSHQLSVFFGRTTTWPPWYCGVTREIEGKTWWLVKPQDIKRVAGNPNFVQFSYFDKDNRRLGDTGTIVENKDIYDQYTTRENRAIVVMNNDEKKRFNITGTGDATAMAVREDSELWDIYYGDKKSGGLLPIITVKSLDKKITNYLEKQTPSKPTQTSSHTGIKKITNYNPVKVMNKINEIIEYLEGKHG